MGQLEKLLKVFGPLLIKLLEWYMNQPRKQQEHLVMTLKQLAPEHFEQPEDDVEPAS